ncbi:MAG TPA: DUF4249 domain-containing protein, partial [Bacteroidales bacterium]
MIIRMKITHIDSLHILLLLLIIFIFPGCQKVINVDLNEAAPRIVIEGVINDRRGPYTVLISKSGSYFNQPVLPLVTGAQVIITDNSGTIDTLREIDSGIYITSKIRGIPGKTYTLKVISENQEFEGSSTMFSHVNIDSLTLVKGEPQRFNIGGNQNENPLEIHCFFRDPLEKNFYRIKVFRNDSINTQNYRLFDDQYTNGQITELRVTHATAGDKYRIELYSLDSKTYGYYRTLEDLIFTNPFFGSTPANPDNNLSNGALGYFGAFAVSSKTITITDSLI